MQLLNPSSDFKNSKKANIYRNALKILTRLAPQQLARHTGRNDSEVISHSFQRLGVLLMRGNAALILSRALDYAPLHIDEDIDS